MSERNNHPEWDNPYIVGADDVIIDLIRSIRGSKSVAAEQSDVEPSEEEL